MRSDARMLNIEAFCSLSGTIVERGLYQSLVFLPALNFFYIEVSFLLIKLSVKCNCCTISNTHSIIAINVNLLNKRRYMHSIRNIYK